MKRILTVLVAVLAVAGWGVPAFGSGAWAVTYVDPAPAVFAGGEPYALGFWVLQHGTHPYAGKLDPVGLRFTRGDGKSVTFDGTALPEPGHFATSVVVSEGVWKVEGIQGWFQPYPVGTLTVPGGLKVDPVPADLVAPFDGSEKVYWGAVRPPGFPLGNATPAPKAEKPASGEATTPASGGGAAGSSSGGGTVAPVLAESAGHAGVGTEGGIPAYALLLAAAGGALLALAALRLPYLVGAARGPGRPSWRSDRRDTGQDPPEEESAETIVIGG
jgi:hypothetical protein